MKDSETGLKPATERSLEISLSGKIPTASKGNGAATLHDGLLQRLRQMIVEGDLACGTRIPERVLCERFKISRTPLREALKVLAWEGFIDLTPNRGATVSRVTIEEIDEVFPVMGAIEALSGEFACKNITDDQFAEIRAFHYQMVLHFQRGELPEYFRLNQAIHGKIVEAAGNATLANIYRALGGRIRRARYMANMTKARWAEAMEEHELILQALEDRNGAGLADILNEHLRKKCEAVKEALLAEETGQAAEG